MTIYKQKFEILLTSKSPRRLQLLTQLGLNVQIVHQDIAENYPENLSLYEVPAYLAAQKASVIAASHLLPNQIVIAADTMVIMDDEVFHKPANFADGQRILSRLQNRTHSVVTGVCMKSKDKELIFADQAQVTFAAMSAQEIDFYLNEFKPYDKAGAYAIQEWVGLSKIIKMEGSFATIMGLPTHLIYQHLLTF
jgi:septum formation protein